MLFPTLLFALTVPTFPTDPAWSTGPVAGLRQVWINPASAAGSLRPREAAPPGEPLVSTEAGALVFTNPVNTWAILAVNGQPVGEITAYATLRIRDVRAGWYELTVTLPSGFVRTFAVQVE